jgi:hypothetical protein
VSGRMQVQYLPDDKFVIVFDNMPPISDNPDKLADYDMARKWLLEAGAAAVLRFDHPVDVS